MTEISQPLEPTDVAETRLRDSIPNAQQVRVNASSRGHITITMHLNDKPHAFALARERGLWFIRDWVLDGKHQDVKKLAAGPRFEAVVHLALGSLAAPPRPRVVDVRCPEKHRQLFMKLIVQGEPDETSPSTLIEVSCPYCKRMTGQITMHVFDDRGSLVKTEQREPYIRQEPGPWFNSEADEPSSTTQQAPKEVAR